VSTAVVGISPVNGLADAVRSEWTKLWTVRSSWMNIVGAVLLTGLVGAQLGFSLAFESTHPSPGHLPSPQGVGSFGGSAILMGQILVAAFALLTVTSEYATGSIRSTLQWTPIRRNVVLAKALVLAPVLFGYGVLLAAVAAVVGGIMAGRWADWNAADLVGKVLTVGVYATLAGLFAVGVAWVVRSTAGALTVVFLLLLVVPLMLSQSTLRALQWIAALTPGGAGQSYLNGTSDPLSPTVSLLVLIAWALAGLVIGTRILTRRDA
jgi:ABC-2 type transport system permease protein